MAKLTDAGPSLLERVMVKVAFLLPELPSVTEVSETENVDRRNSKAPMSSTPVPLPSPSKGRGTPR